MQTIDSTGLIRIVKTPAGDPPLGIREAWVGLILPCDPYLGFSDDGNEHGVLDRKATPNRCGFSVPQSQAIEILERERPGIAKWWREHGFPKPDEYFGFAESEAEIISGVTHQKIICVTDEMTGSSSR